VFGPVVFGSDGVVETTLMLLLSFIAVVSCVCVWVCVCVCVCCTVRIHVVCGWFGQSVHKNGFGWLGLDLVSIVFLLFVISVCKFRPLLHTVLWPYGFVCCIESGFLWFCCVGLVLICRFAMEIVVCWWGFVKFFWPSNLCFAGCFYRVRIRVRVC